MKKTNKKPNILIAYQYLSFKGGIEEVIYNQSDLLTKKGYHVELLTSEYLKKEKNISRNNIAIHRIPSINIAYRLFGIPFAIPVLSPKNIRKIASLIKKSDVINVHGHPYFASFIYIVIAKLHKKKVILTQHNTNIESKSTFINIVYTLFDRTIGKYNLTASNKIIAVSEETKKYIETITSDKLPIEVIYNGVNTKRFSPHTSKASLRSRFNVPKNKFVCLSIRRLTFKNGIETLLDTARISDQNKTLFLIGGTGPDQEKIEQYIKANKIGNVKMLGFVSDSDLASYYALSDLFILPSIQGEGFPMVVLEAFSSGIPVIATKSGGHIEIVKNGQTGYIVPINQPDQIQKKIAYLISQPNIIKKMSINCRALVLKNLSWNENIKKLSYAFAY